MISPLSATFRTPKGVERSRKLLKKTFNALKSGDNHRHRRMAGK